MLWYVINISIIVVFIALFLVTRQMNKRWSKINDYLGMVTNTVNSVRYGNLSTKIEKIEHPTYQNVTDSINIMFETLHDREKMIVEYQAELIRQNKLLESVINSLSDGILIVNEQGNILRATPKIIKWFGVKGNDILGKNVYDFIEIDGGNTIEKLSDTIKYFPDDVITDKGIGFVIAELIREKILWHINDEVPHGVGVVVEQIVSNSNIEMITATIYCEKQGHKSIIIGSKGEKIKEIGQECRLALQKMLSKKVNLELWVKVKPNWRNREGLLSEIGYASEES